ncbi:MAG TPA: MaoC family dehydratase [Methylomusa anaerophila]|uniref:(R)-specific enoyl-CoA hydratase n=1 Tax=Methylomusa anaerophila TaxID=1930071 RepID=A0A348AM53_9FIRM|nr:MaoC family dehydratase [Methylomusa anaerophila]BBB92151.1 (R)-specific enoyl-CoA hydratase [Methylomusa anaerophila]HML87835.1 MaoC family dehydratase [Methylomusa anaerophila]
MVKMVRNIKFADIKIGDKASMSKTITAHDVYTYANLTGDLNPLHTDADYAKTTVFKEPIAHGMLSAGFISAVLGTVLPGANTIYLGQELSFKAPVKIGDTVTATVEVMEKIEGKSRLILKTTVTNQAGTVVIDGKATVRKKD